jgi:hypothetical protein
MSDDQLPARITADTCLPYVRAVIVDDSLEAVRVEPV